jgi:hypothetical protein
MTKYTMDMVLEYAKVFPQNADMGSPDGPRAAQAIFQKGGQYAVNGYFTDENQIQELIAGGLDPKPMNSDRILEGNSDYGIGKFMRLKRAVTDVKTFTDRKTGDPVEVDYGGVPKVVDLTQGKDNRRLWDFEKDGALGNGTKAKVQFETYASGAGIRLLNVGVTEHVSYVSLDEITEDDELFMVG